MASIASPYGLGEAARELARLARGRGDLWWQVGDSSQWTPRRQETNERLRGADRLVASLAAITARIEGGWWTEGHSEMEVVLSDGSTIVPVTTSRSGALTATADRLARVTDALLLGAGTRVLVSGTRKPSFSEERGALLVPSDDAWRGTEAGAAQLVDAIARMRLSADTAVCADLASLVASLACAFTLADAGIAPATAGEDKRAPAQPSRTTQPKWLDLVADTHTLTRCVDVAESLSDELEALVVPDAPRIIPVSQKRVDVCRRGNGCEAPAHPETPSGPYTLRQAMRTASAASEALADSSSSVPT